MNWNLIIEDDAGKTIVVPLARDQITIGRKEGNTIRLTERNVSRFHAKLMRENGHVFIEDLKSYNGIKVNGDRIAGRIPVQEGDLIEIGDYHLALQAQDAVEPALAGGAPPPQKQPQAGMSGMSGMKSSALDAPTQNADDDEFAGDTQRWEPPATMDPLSVGSMAPLDQGRELQPNSEPTAQFPPSRGGREMPTLDERMPVMQVDTGKLSRAEGLPPPHGWPPPSAQPGPSFASIETHGQQAAPPPQMVGATNGALFTTNLHAEETMRTSSTGNRTSPLPSSEDIPTASPFDIVDDAEPMPPLRGGLPPPSSPGQPAFEATQPMAMPPTRAPAKPATPLPAPAAPPPPAFMQGTPGLSGGRVHEEQTEALRPSLTPPVESELSAHRLVVLNTVFAGSTFPVRSPEMIVGRTEDNDITIEHRSVSRNHAKLVRETDRLRIVDLKSANGVLVNGEEVDNVVLRTGDVIELGRVRIRYVPPGERFVVPPDEIERARVADAVGDEFADEPGTHITTPLRAQASRPVVAKSKVPIYAAAAGAVVVVGMLVVLLLRGGPPPDAPPAPDDRAPPSLPKPDAPATRIDPAPIEPLTTPPATPPATPPMTPPMTPPAGPAAIQAIPPPAAPVEPPPVDDANDANDAKALAAKKRMDDAIGAGDLATATTAFAELPRDWKGTAEAKASLDAVRKSVVEDALKSFDAALLAKDFGKAKAAMDELKLAVPKHPKLPFLEKRLASAEKAATTADKAAKKKPEAEPEAAGTTMSPQEALEKARGLVREATGAFMSGDLATSLEKLKEAKQLSPKLADVHRNLGVVYARRGEKEAAYKAYKQFLELQPAGEEADKVRAIVEQYEATKGGK